MAKAIVRVASSVKRLKLVYSGNKAVATALVVYGD